ncbi:acyltransferase domain-containing protein [Nocardia sp. NPDC005978]|uniref:acyltransferase domain-containing protein n=1 Tax=Nocardia sp. NPDC005978 TaxID=3156725 RepID=UPI0033AB2A39
MSSHRLPDGTIPVPLSSDTGPGLRAEAAAVAGYLECHAAVGPDRVSDMLFRTRTVRRHRALAMVTARSDLLQALRAIAAGVPHPLVVAGDGPATARRIGFVFPGQGGQRPGMGGLYYELSPAYRAAVDACAALHAARFGQNQPLHYLLGDEGRFQDEVWEVQPALMFHMTGLAAMWRAAGVHPAATIGHSQGELAAGAVSAVMSLHDAVLVVTHRSRLVERLSPRGYSMAVLAMDREECEALLARHSGWAELSVVNSPHIMAVSGTRETVGELVVSATGGGRFAREIRVAYPAHTSIVAELRADLGAFLSADMENEHFLPTEILCYGSTLGEILSPELAQEEYWYWNLRNRVRFDRAVVAAATDGIDTFIEVVEHPVLQLAIQENLTLVPPDPVHGPRDYTVLATSLRTATGLTEFTRNLAAVAVADLNYDWDALRTGEPPALPLRDFPHTVMNERRLWAPIGHDDSRIHPPPPPVPAPQRLVETWIPWNQRSLTPPRRIALIDPTDDCAELTAALVRSADRYGASAEVLSENESDLSAYDTLAILLSAPSATATGANTDLLATFFAESRWISAATAFSAAAGKPAFPQNDFRPTRWAAPCDADEPVAAAGLASDVRQRGARPASPSSWRSGAGPENDRGTEDVPMAGHTVPTSGDGPAGAVPGVRAGRNSAVPVVAGGTDLSRDDRGASAEPPAAVNGRAAALHRELWLITVGGETVTSGEDGLSPYLAAAAAGFRCAGAELPGARVRHLDLSAGSGIEQAARAIGALHTAGEPEMALRAEKVFVKRLVSDDSAPGPAADLGHVLIVGGTGKLGLLFAEHFARTGAIRVTLLSRTGESPSIAADLVRLRGIGRTEIEVAACDVVDPAALALFAGASAARPVSLLIHAAVDYVAADLADIGPDLVVAATAAKVIGLESVLATVARTPTCRIVLCSSLAATIGGRGQALYAAANRLLDVTARRLRADGLDATALQWSLWSEAGPLDADGFARVSGVGVYPMNPPDAIAAGLTGAPADAVIISADWPTLRDVLDAFGQAPLLALVPDPPEQAAGHRNPAAEPFGAGFDRPGAVIGRAGSSAGQLGTAAARGTPGGQSMQDRTSEAANRPSPHAVPGPDASGPEGRSAAAGAPVPADTRPLADRVLTELERVMGVAPGEHLDRSIPLVALGLDSLQALDFRKRVRSVLDRDLPVAAILGGASFDDVVSLMAQNTIQR